MGRSPYYQSPSTKIRNLARSVKFFTAKFQSQRPLTLSLNCLPATNIAPQTRLFTTTKPILTEYPPISEESRLKQAETIYLEMLKVKDDHIQFLKDEIANLPATIINQIRQNLQQPLSQLQQLQPP